MRLSSRGYINSLIQIYKNEERSPEALHSYLSKNGINIEWKALMNRWKRV